jgi:hypothetical protein
MLDAILDLIDNYGTPPSTAEVAADRLLARAREIAKAKPDHPVGIAYTEGAGIREVKP